MNQKYNYYGVLSVAGLIVVLGIALGFDALTTIRQLSIEALPLSLFVFWHYAFNYLAVLLLAAVTLFLFWFVLNRASRNVWIALIFLLTGSFVLAYPVLYYTPTFCCLPLPAQLNNILINSRSYFFYSGSFIAIMGLFELVFPKGKGKEL